MIDEVGTPRVAKDDSAAGDGAVISALLGSAAFRVPAIFAGVDLLKALGRLSLSLARLPDLLGRPISRPLGSHDRVSRARVNWRLNLNEIVDLETVGT